MDPSPGGPLQEISINRIKGHRKILQKRESQNITKSPTKSPRKLRDSTGSVIVNSDEIKAPEKENNFYNKSPLIQLVPNISVARCLSNIEINGACKILNNSIKAKENIPLTVCSSPETLNKEKKSFSKDSCTPKKPTTEFVVTSNLPQTSKITQISDGNKAAELAKQEEKISDKSELTSIDVKSENQYSRTISIGNVEVVVLGESVVISPNQNPQQIETSTAALPSIDGTGLIQTYEQTQTNLSAPNSSTDGSDGQTHCNSNSSGDKLVSSEPDSGLADNYLGTTITDSESSASETSFSSSPLSSASVTNLALLPTSTSKGFPKPLNEQISTDNEPVSSGIAVTSSVFQSVSSQASYCKSSQRAPLSRRNARERNRVRLVSQGFAILRQHVPQAARRKKLSKVETLRCAVDYIKALSRMIEENNASNNLVPSPSNSSTLCNSFGTLNETSQTSSFQLDSSRVKHERDEHRHPLHEGLQRQHLQTMLPIDSSCLLNASMLSKHREQCLQIAPSRHHKDGTDFSSAPGVSSSNAMLTPRVFNLPLNEPDVLGCQFIEFPCNSDLAYVPAVLCASSSSVPTIQTISQAPLTSTSAAPISRYAMPTITSIVPNAGDVPSTTSPKIMPLIASTSTLVSISSTVTNTAATLNAPLNHIPPSIISTLHHTSPSVVSTLYKPSPTISSTTDLTSPTISNGVLSEDSYSSSPIPGVSALMDNQEELFDGDETDDAELMDCLSWWQETP